MDCLLRDRVPTAGPSPASECHFIQILLNSTAHRKLKSSRAEDVILDGWPDFKEDTPLAVRYYWPFRDELNVQNDVLLKRIYSSHTLLAEHES